MASITPTLRDVGCAGVPEVEELGFLAFELVPEDFAGDLEKAFPLLAKVNVRFPGHRVDMHYVWWIAPRASELRGIAIADVQMRTHTPNLDEAPEMYKTFRDKKDGCIKVVLKP